MFQKFNNLLKILALFVTILMGLSTAWPLFAQQNVEATIEGGVVRAIKVAIPEFTDESGNTADLAEEMREVVINDLRSSGLFIDLPEESYLTGNGPFASRVDFSAWNGIGADIYIKAAVSAEADGKIAVKFRLYDVISEEEKGDGLQFKGTADDVRRMGHKIADAVYSRVTGEGPYFDSKIVFVSETGPKGERVKRIATMDSDGANLQILTDGEALVLAPRWAGNARDIIFTSYHNEVPEVVMMDTETGEAQPLSELPGLSYAPRFSPDGTKLLVALIDDQGNSDLFEIDLETGMRTQLTFEPYIETAGSYSPDGSQIVFESDRTGSQQLFVMPKEGGAAVQISQGEGKYATPVWSPRGDLIAFTKISDGQFHIGVMNVDGSDEREITSAFIDEGPSWAPNGRVLMFFRETAGEGGAPKLQSISLSGRNMVEIDTPDFASDPNWSMILP